MTLTGRFDGVQQTLVLTRQFRTSIDDVWASIAESDRLSRWFGTWTGDPSTGTVSVTMNAEAEPMPAVPYEIRRCEPPKALSVRVSDEYGTWTLTAELAAVDGTTHADPHAGGRRSRDARTDRPRLGVVSRQTRGRCARRTDAVAGRFREDLHAHDTGVRSARAPGRMTVASEAHLVVQWMWMP